MEPNRSYFDPRTLAKLHGLQLRARHIVEGYLAGLHRSPYHGFSIEFAEHREYVPGDDVRHIDWKVFGRTDKYYLKQYEDETNLLCHVVVDVSESMQYRGPESPLSKLEYAQCAAATLAWLVLHQQDAVGLVTYDDQVRGHLRPSGSPAQLKQVLQLLDATRSVAKTSAGPILHDLAQRWKKRGVVVVLSDFFDDLPALLTGLAHLRNRRHDVALWHVLDAAELEFPFYRPTQFNGLEQFPTVQTDPRWLRQAYLREMEAFRRRLEQGCRAHDIDYRLLRTDLPLDQTLSGYLASRQARVK